MRTIQVITEKPSLTEYATIARTCALLNVSAMWVYQLIRMGEREAAAERGHGLHQLHTR